MITFKKKITKYFPKVSIFLIFENPTSRIHLKIDMVDVTRHYYYVGFNLSIRIAVVYFKFKFSSYIKSNVLNLMIK